MGRRVEYDLLRVTACFAVVLLHISNSYWGVVDVNGSDFAVMTVFNSFTRFGVPVFFMLSGLFLLDPGKELSARKWAGKIGKLLLSFFLWSVFYAFQSVLFNGILHGWNSVTKDMWSNAFTRLVMGHGHMWFLLDLLGFYLLVPVLRKICEDTMVLGYFLLLWVFFRFAAGNFLSDVWEGRVMAFITSMHLYVFTGYIGYFMGGFFLYKTEIPRRWRYLIYAGGTGGLLFTILKTLADSRRTLEHDDHWCSPSSLNILLFSIAVFVFFKQIRVPEHANRSGLAAAMAGSTFFVYMVHPFFIEKLNLLGIKVISFPPVISIPVMTVGIFAAAMVLGWLAGKIPVVGKWITFQ